MCIRDRYDVGGGEASGKIKYVKTKYNYVFINDVFIYFVVKVLKSELSYVWTEYKEITV